MKNLSKKVGQALLVLSAVGFAGCAGIAPSSAVFVPSGGLYQKTTAPLTYKTPFKVGGKVGRGSISYLYIPLHPILSLSIGDGSIKSAAASAGINQIQHVDYARTNFLGVFTTTEVIVYGD